MRTTKRSNTTLIQPWSLTVVQLSFVESYLIVFYLKASAKLQCKAAVQATHWSAGTVGCTWRATGLLSHIMFPHLRRLERAECRA